MKKLLIIFFINIFAVNSAYSTEEVLNSLKEGGKIIFIRHALAPGNGDPENFDLNDCSTQRNLNQRGIEQSKFIGSIFNKNQIKIENVYSSEWCRCIDTAKFALINPILLIKSGQRSLDNEHLSKLKVDVLFIYKYDL